MTEPTTFHPSVRVFRVFQALTFLGAATVAAVLVLMPERAWANVLLISTYLVGLALGGLVLLALHYVTGARWSIPLRRVPEALSTVLPVAAVGMLAALLFHPSLYKWYEGSHAGMEPASPLRTLWLDRAFFVARAVIYLAVWLAFAFAFVRASRRQQRVGGALAGGFLVVFGVTCWLASSDWLMSLDPEWTSTVFSVYNFAGLLLSAVAAVTLLAILLRQFGPLRDVITRDHLHDLGTLVFAFSCFWMYTWFCQYLLIWYTNHPIETEYLRARAQGTWPTVLYVDLILNWGIPFVVLLFREAKRLPWILAAICLLVLGGRWVDLFLMIFPSQGPSLAVPGIAEIGFALGGTGILALAVLRALSRGVLVPTE
jgi:hypothetical protein